MQVEAIYIQGRIEFVNPIKLKHDHLRLVVLVPDDEIETQSTPYELSPDVLQKAEQMRQRIDAARRAPLSPDDELPKITAKQLERIEAFELRAQMRREQGRPV
ncbi:MAG: hypothetical protein WAS49_09185 [Candidatus Dechloromonas phosphoritropha]|jgi:hypothetical protein|nr:hypothetical protein [Candidatus Dechloromonas phosphoritropha]MBP8787939.1 hypothetical protein [Azonexus sp.]